MCAVADFKPMATSKSWRELAVAALTASLSGEDTLTNALDGLWSAATKRQMIAKARSLKVAARLMPEAAEDAVRCVMPTHGGRLRFRDKTELAIWEQEGRFYMSSPRRVRRLASYRIKSPVIWTVHQVPARVVLEEIVRRGGPA